MNPGGRANWLQNAARCGVLVAMALAYPVLGFANGRTFSPSNTITTAIAANGTSSYATAQQIASLGYSVATANTANGMVLVIGAPHTAVSSTPTVLNSAVTDAGAAYVFTVPTGGWVGTLPKPTILYAGTPTEYSDFGDSVAISPDGNTIIVGAPGVDKAYVFHASNGGWPGGGAYSNETITDGTSGDWFGASVAVSNNFGTPSSPQITAVVGAEDATESNSLGTSETDAGAAYVFYYTSTGWSATPSLLTASDPAQNDLFGESVAITGDGGTILVGSSGFASNTSAVGAAYVFTGSDLTWSAPTAISDPADQQNDAFGTSVAIGGTSSAATAVIGAPGATSGEGTAYVFAYPLSSSSLTWSEQAAISDPGGVAGDLFGTSVAISADASVIAVGAPDAPSSSSGTPALYEFDSPTHGKNPGSYSGHLKSYTYELSSSTGTYFGDSAAVGIDSSGTAWIFGGASGIPLITSSTVPSPPYAPGAAYVFTQ